MNKKGFTLVELLLVLAIFAILFAIVGTISSHTLLSSQVKVESDAVEQVLRKAQARTVSRHADSVWGVHIASTSVLLFAGNSYAGRDASYDELRSFPEAISASGLSDIIFQFRTGATVNTGTITLTHGATGERSTISVAATGLVEQ